MVRVHFDTCSVWAKGHAGQANKGADIVCASVSTLLYLLATEVIRMDEEGLLMQKPVVRMLPGDVCINASPRAAERKRLEYLFATTGRMFQVLAQSYPDYVSYESGKTGEHKDSPT